MSAYRDYVERVRAEHDVRALLAERGRKTTNGMVVCPFHPDTNPSCSVTDRLYCCFACGAKGDVFRLIQKLDNLEFMAAVDVLAKRAGLPTYRPHPTDARQVLDEANTANLTEFATELYEKFLREDSEPWKYLVDGRGLTPEVVRDRRLGWASANMLTTVFSKKPEAHEALVTAGLAMETRNALSWSGQAPYRDLFERRVTLPVIGSGRQATFLSGRSIDPGVEPKYLHQRGLPAPLFNADLLVGTEDAYIVEGQIDALSLHCWGLPAAAIMGTMHADSLAPLRGRRRVYLCLDADRAGRSAILRLAPAIWPTPVLCVRLPDGMDPNDYYRSHTREDLLALVEQAVDPVQFTLDLASPDAPPADLTAQLMPLIDLLATLAPVTAEAYLAGTVAKWAGTRKGLVRAVAEMVQDAKKRVRLQCPVCSTMLVGRRGV